MSNKGPWNTEEVLCPPLTEVDDQIKKVMIANIRMQHDLQRKENKVCDCECHTSDNMVMHMAACC